VFAYGISPETVSRLTAELSAERYEGNVYAEIREAKQTKRAGEWRVRFVLRCRSSKGEGARTSASGRRTVSATWEAHGLLFNTLFDAGLRRIDAGPVTYTAEKWEGRASWEDWQVGSMFAPAFMSQL
jgi:hypothetical protein